MKHLKSDMIGRLTAGLLMILLILSAAPAFSVKADDSGIVYKRKVVAVVYDNSGSMSTNDPEHYAEYAMQNLIGSLRNEDTLIIVPMNKRGTYTEYTIDMTKDRAKEYEKAEAANLFTTRDTTPGESVGRAVEVLKKHGMLTVDQAAASAPGDCEYWLIVMTDGIFDNNADVRDVIRQAQGFSDLHTEYLSIGSNAVDLDDRELNGDMIFFSHHAENASGIVEAVQDICCQMTGRYRLPDSAITLSGKQMTIDLNGCDFTAAGLCVILQDCGTTLKSVSYNGKNVTPTSTCVLKPSSILSRLKSGETALLTGPFTGGTLTLTYKNAINSAKAAVLIEPALRIEAFASANGREYNAATIRSELKTGDTVTFGYRMLDSRTGKELDPKKIFGVMDETVTYAGSTYRVGQQVSLKEGREYATVYVSCMNGSYVMTDSLFCMVLRNPDDFSLREKDVERSYGNDRHKTRITYTIKCNGTETNVSGLLANHYTKPEVSVTDAAGRPVTSVASVGTDADGKPFVILDLSSVSKQSEYYTVTLSTVTDSTVPAAEADRMSAVTKIETIAVTSADMKITGTVVNADDPTAMCVSFAVESGGAAVSIDDLTAAGCSYTVTVKDSAGKELKPTSANVQDGRLLVTVDLTGTPDACAEAVITVTDAKGKAEGSVKLAFSWRQHSLEITPEDQTPGTSELGVYTLGWEVKADGKTIPSDRLAAMWLTVEITASGAKASVDPNGKSALVDTTDGPTVNTTAVCRLISKANEDAGAAVAEGRCELKRPAIDPSRIRIQAADPVGDSKNHCISRLSYAVTLDGEPLTPDKMTYLGISWKAEAHAAEDGQSVPISCSVDKAAGAALAELDTTGRSYTKYTVLFTLRDDPYNCELGSAEKTITRYDFWFEALSTEDSTGYGTDVTMRFRLMDHGQQVDKAGLSAFTCTLTCIDPNGAPFPFTQDILDDGTFVVRVQPGDGGYRRLGLYRVTASAVNAKGQPGDNAGEGRFTRVPMSFEIKPVSSSAMSLNPWQCMNTQEEWAFDLLLEGESYPFDGEWAAWTFTFDGRSIPDNVRIENGRLIFKPDPALLGADSANLPPVADHPVRLEVKAAVEPGLTCESALWENCFSVVNPTYTVVLTASDDTTLDRFASVFKRTENTAVLNFSVLRDGEPISTDDLQILMDSGEISISRDWLKNPVFWLFFKDELTVETDADTGKGLLRCTVARSRIPDVLHFTRCIILNGDNRLTILCGDSGCDASVSAARDPVRLYIHWIGVTILFVYCMLWFIGLFTFRHHLPSGYFVSIDANEDNEQLGVRIKKVNMTWSDRWLWSVFCPPWRLFADQRPVSFASSVTLVCDGKNHRLVVKKKNLNRIYEQPDVQPYQAMISAMKSGGRYEASKKLLREIITPQAFCFAVIMDGEPALKGSSHPIGQMFAVSETDEEDIAQFRTLIQFVKLKH